MADAQVSSETVFPSVPGPDQLATQPLFGYWKKLGMLFQRREVVEVHVTAGCQRERRQTRRKEASDGRDHHWPAQRAAVDDARGLALLALVGAGQHGGVGRWRVPGRRPPA